MTHLCHTETVGGATAVRFTCGNQLSGWRQTPGSIYNINVYKISIKNTEIKHTKKPLMGNVHTVTHLCHTETVGGATAVRFTLCSQTWTQRGRMRYINGHPTHQLTLPPTLAMYIVIHRIKHISMTVWRQYVATIKQNNINIWHRSHEERDLPIIRLTSDNRTLRQPALQTQRELPRLFKIKTQTPQRVIQ